MMMVVVELEFCVRERFLSKQVLTSLTLGETDCHRKQQPIDLPWQVANMKPWASPW